MSTWLIIGTEAKPKCGFTDNQVLRCLQQEKNDIFYVEPSTFHTIPDVLKSNKIDVIYWEAINGWLVWEQIKSYPAKKINTWYDDPVQRIDLANISQVMKENQQLVDIRVWDSYWIGRLQDSYGITSTLTHLAVDPNEYYTTSLACSDKPIFIGALHSPRKIARLQDNLCDPFKTILESIRNSLDSMADIPSWDQIEGHYVEGLGDGDRRLYNEIATMDRKLHGLFRQCIWMMSKNEVRVRMLRAALEVSEVIMFSECDQVNHPGEHELRALIGKNEHKLIFHNTSGVSPSQLATFNHYGWVHLQAVDPQSVNEGYPYRVFQTMASGKVLLTDFKAKWGVMGMGMLRYGDTHQLKEQLNTALKDKNMCKAIGHGARRTCEEKHTWKHRLTL